MKNKLIDILNFLLFWLIATLIVIVALIIIAGVVCFVCWDFNIINSMFSHYLDITRISIVVALLLTILVYLIDYKNLR